MDRLSPSGDAVGDRSVPDVLLSLLEGGKGAGQNVAKQENRETPSADRDLGEAWEYWSWGCFVVFYESCCWFSSERLSWLWETHPTARHYPVNCAARIPGSV